MVRYKDRSDYLIGVLVDSLKILEQFLYDNPELGISELSEKTGLHKNKVFRVLSTFEYLGYIEQNPETQQYHLGIKILQLGQRYLQQSGLAILSDRLLSELHRETEETVVLATFTDNVPVLISVKNSPHKLRVTVSEGEHHPLHASATGKILLYGTYEKKGGIPPLHELTKYTDNTIISKEDLLKNIKEISKKNYAVDREEWQEGIIAIAAPVRDYTTHIVASVGVMIPSIRFSGEEEIAQKVITVANELSFKLGFTYLPPV